MLIVRPKPLAARAKQSVIICASSSECATRAQSSAYRKSNASNLVILDVALSRQRLKISPISSVVHIDAKVVVVKGI